MSTYTVDVNREDGLSSAIVDGLPGNAFVGLDFERFSDARDGVQEALIDFFDYEEFTLERTFRDRPPRLHPAPSGRLGPGPRRRTCARTSRPQPA